MPRSLYKEGVRHPLNPENSEFSHSLGRIPTILRRLLVLALIKLLSVPPSLKRRPLQCQDNELTFSLKTGTYNRSSSAG